MTRKIFVLLLTLLIPTMAVLAQGKFDYITVKGPGLTGDVDVTNPALTEDFFIFADFTQGEVPAPADPGEGYQIVRMYVEYTDSKPKNLPFDLLYYYPYTGYVYYDGVLEGSSEYDGKWYAANPEAETPFRNVLVQRALLTWIPFAVLAVILAGFFIAYNRKPKE